MNVLDAEINKKLLPLWVHNNQNKLKPDKFSNNNWAKVNVKDIF